MSRAHLSRAFLLAAASFAALSSSAAAAATLPVTAASTFDSAILSGLGARNIGSATMSGRVSAIAGRHEKDGSTLLLVGAASGGLWKSQDDGTTFRPIFDKEDVQSIGAIALDPNHPDTYWVGTGESWMRNSVSVGDGVYKTTDGGETWTHMGLPASEHISKILVDPSNSDTVYVCVPGRLWSDSADRGLYKTRDGGKTWTLILKGANLSSGCSTLSMDPSNPNKLIAGMWDFRRTGWGFRSGGEDEKAPSGSDLLVTEDGGATWKSLKSPGDGLPDGPWGREAVAFAPSDPKVVYAFVESAKSALYRSDDGGKTWAPRDRSQWMVWRPFYFANLKVDPKDPNRVFKTDFSLIVSDDGGRSFTTLSQSIHPDQHDLWIDPSDTKHIVVGNDGGLWISHDGANRWSKVDNLPISQFYHVSLDDKDPYQVYGGLQDNAAWVGDTAYPGGVTNGRWENIGGGDGFWAWPDPADPDGFAYSESQGGSVVRVNRHTHEMRDIQPQSDTAEKLRFNWNTPLVVSPNDKGEIYIGAQYLFRSRDHGQTWDKISPDLTTNDPSKQQQEKSGGITVDNSAAETYTTIYAISESPKAAGQIWVGTDDGNVQLTRDGGAHWNNLTAKIGVPARSWVSWIEASPYDAAVAYAAFDRHVFGDFEPYIYRTSDYGQTWTRIASPAQGMRGQVWVIKEDPERPGLLYAGTEFGLWISPDGGKRWAQFKGGGLPDVPVRDIAFQNRDKDLAIATHGRGIWIVDDLTPLRGLTEAVMEKPISILPARPDQERIEGNGGWSNGDASFVGPDPTDGAVISYYEPHRHLYGKLRVEVLDPSGKILDTLPASTRPGINRVTWGMRDAPPRVPPAAQVAFNASQGPRVLPGVYEVRITSGDLTVTAPFQVTLDRRDHFDLAARKAQYEALTRISALFGRMTDLDAQIVAVAAQTAARAAALPPADPLRGQLQTVAGEAEALRKRIVATTEGGAITGELRLREYADDVYGAISSYDGAPAAYQLARIDELTRQLEKVQGDFDALRNGDFARANSALKAKAQSPIAIPSVAAERTAAGSGAGGDAGQALGARGWMFSLHPAATANIADEGERD